MTGSPSRSWLLERVYESKWVCIRHYRDVYRLVSSPFISNVFFVCLRSCRALHIYWISIKNWSSFIMQSDYMQKYKQSSKSWYRTIKGKLQLLYLCLAQNWFIIFVYKCDSSLCKWHRKEGLVICNCCKILNAERARNF